MRPQTLNYWNGPIPARTQFGKTVGNPAKFALSTKAVTNVSFSCNAIDTLFYSREFI